MGKKSTRLIILGDPIAAPRARVGKFGTYYSKKYKRARIDYATQITNQIQRDAIVIGPIELSVLFVHRRPKSMRKNPGRIPKTTRPDLDNLVKTVLDGITASKYWKDDSQVVSLHALDFYGDLNEDPHVLIEINEI